MPSLHVHLINLHAAAGDRAFVAGSLVFSLALALVAIPRATHWMVNGAAGLADKHLGGRWRTLTINASTNNPEAVSMLVSFGIGKVGGWGNPLGSLLANIYLLYLGAFAFVLVRLMWRRRWTEVREMLAMLRREWRLCALHVGASLAAFAIGFGALQLMMRTTSDPTRLGTSALMTGILLLSGIALGWYLVEHRLKRTRPELFDDVDASHFTPSWSLFLGGTAAVLLLCWLMNEMFIAWSEIYRSRLTTLFGPLVFTWIHYFVGALITSLPELTVAVHCLEKRRVPDLNTALGSVSISNMVNLALGLLGLIVWFGLAAAGAKLTW